MTNQPTPPSDAPHDRPTDPAPPNRPPQPDQPAQWSQQQYWQPPVQPPPPGQIPPGQYGYVVYQQPYNTLAILALVLGVMVLPPLGIYFGYKAQQQIAQTGERGVELAKAGVVVGWILTGLYGLIFVVWCGFAALFYSHAPQ